MLYNYVCNTYMMYMFNNNSILNSVMYSKGSIQRVVFKG